MIYEMDENDQNSKLKNHSRESSKKNDRLEHFKRIQIVDDVEDGKISPYESLGWNVDLHLRILSSD
jgi:hypothetical protein